MPGIIGTPITILASVKQTNKQKTVHSARKKLCTIHPFFQITADFNH